MLLFIEYIDNKELKILILFLNEGLYNKFFKIIGGF